VYAPIEEVKIVRDRSTGESRGFAFVEFPSIQDAKTLLQYTSGHIQIEGSTVYLSYSYQQQQQTQPTSHHQQQQAHHQHQHRSNESKDPNWLCSQVILKFKIIHIYLIYIF
jgi:RNA-binding protein 5/10